MDKQRIAILQSQLETSWDGILVVAPDKTIILTNDRFHRMWRITPQIAALQDDAVQIRTILDQLIDPDAFLARVQYLTEHPEETSLEYLSLKDGRTFERHSSPLYDPDNVFLGRIWYFRDVTQTKDMEEAMLKLKKFESVGVLAGGIAHDFNNILTAVLGNIQLSLFHVETNNEAASLLQDARKAAQQAQALTNQLLTLSRNNTPIKQETRIDDIIKESCKSLEENSNIHCTLKIADALTSVDCDSKQIGEAIQHLLDNARQAMPDGGTVRISAENVFHPKNSKLPPGDFVSVTISDHGYGIAAKNLDRIFDPYFTTKTLGKDQGTGLGLAMVHSIVNKHGGFIQVESEKGEGTSFHILLPAGNNR